MRYLTAILVLVGSVGCGSPDGALGGEPPLFTTQTGGFATVAATGGSETGGSTPVATGGFVTVGAGGSTGGLAATGGSSTGGVSTGGSAILTGGVATGGALATGGSTGGLAATGGSLSTGGSTGGTLATGGTKTTGGEVNTCKPPSDVSAYQIGAIVSAPVAGQPRYLECVKPGCTGSNINTAAWLKVACDSTCQTCNMGCNAPTAGYQDVGTYMQPVTDYAEYMAAVEPGWQMKVQLADGCGYGSGLHDGTNCLYQMRWTVVKCVGTAEECRQYDPRYELCSVASAVGKAPPCRDLTSRPNPVWQVVTICE